MTHHALLSAIHDKTTPVGVIGLGYVGLPLAVTAAARGFAVTGFDVDATKAERLAKGESYIEAVSNGALKNVTDTGHFRWSTDFSGLKDCRVIIICVPTPLTRHREPDLSFVEANRPHDC